MPFFDRHPLFMLFWAPIRPVGFAFKAFYVKHPFFCLHETEVTRLTRGTWETPSTPHGCCQWNMCILPITVPCTLFVNYCQNLIL